MLLVGALVGLAVGISSLGFAQGLKFTHVMGIGFEGTGPGQFKYVEDFAFDSKGNHKKL